ncbi:MAG: hypothetical protein ACI4XF_00985 [Oscillospiraceae bacterium]
MKTYRSDKKGYSFLLAITTFATAVIIALLKFLLEKIEIMYPNLFEKERSVPEIIIYTAIIVFIAAYVIFAVIFLRLWHRSLQYTITSTEIISQSGFLTKTKQIMKLSAIQYFSGISLPLSALSSFNFIIVSALGGTMAMLFLSDEDYREITEILRRNGKT